MVRPPSPLRVVIDANVLVSATFGGVPARAVARALREEVWISEEVARELTGLADRLARKLPPEGLRAWEVRLVAFLSAVRKAETGPSLRVCRDPKDDAYLTLAKAVAATHLVTGDRDLLSIRPRDLGAVGLASLRLVSPRRFLAECP